MKQLTDNEIKEYVKKTIRQGNKKRIKIVMDRWLERRKTEGKLF